MPTQPAAGVDEVTGSQAPAASRWTSSAPARPRLAPAVTLAGVLTFGAASTALGALSASAADLSLSPLTYAHADQVNSGTLTLTSSDSGPTALGWNVTIQSSALAYSGPNGGAAIPAANLAITVANPPTVVSGQAIDPTGGPRVPVANATGTLEVARRTLEAAADFGLGTYQQGLGVTLTVPGGSRAGTYTATLTVTIASGP